VPAYILETGRSYRNPIEAKDFLRSWDGYEGVPDGYQIEFYDEGPGSLPLGKDNVHYIGDEQEIIVGTERMGIYRFYKGGTGANHDYWDESVLTKDDFPGEKNKGKAIKAYHPEPRRNAPIFYMLDTPEEGTAVPFHRHYSSTLKNTKLTSNTSEAGYTNCGVIGYMAAGQTAAQVYGGGEVPLYHYFSTVHNNDFYTTNPSDEVNLSGGPIPPKDVQQGQYVYQGIIGWAYTTPFPSPTLGAYFDSTGNNLVVTGSSSGNIDIEYRWNDNPGTASVNVDTIQIGTKTWTRSGRSGNQSEKISGLTPGSYPITYTNLHAANSPIEVRDGGQWLCLKDGHGNDCNGILRILMVEDRRQKTVIDVGKIGPCGQCVDKTGWYDYRPEDDDDYNGNSQYTYFMYRQQMDQNGNRWEGTPAVNGWGDSDFAEMLTEDALFEWSYGLNGAVKGSVPRYLGFEDMYDSQFVYYLYDTSFPWNGPIYSIQYTLSDAACCPNAEDSSGCPECIPNYTYHSHFYSIREDMWQTSNSRIELSDGNSTGVNESFWVADTSTTRLLFRYTSTTGAFKRGEMINGWLISEVRYFGDKQKCGFMELNEMDSDMPAGEPFVYRQTYTAEDGATAIALAGFGIFDKCAFFGVYEFRKNISYYRVEVNQDALVAMRTLDEAKLEPVINDNGELVDVIIINSGKGYNLENIQLAVSSPGVMEEFTGGDLASEMYNQNKVESKIIPTWPPETVDQGDDLITTGDYDIQLFNAIEKGSNTLSASDDAVAKQVVFNRGKAVQQKQAIVRVTEIDDSGSIIGVIIDEGGAGYTADHPPYIAVVIPDKKTAGFDGTDMSGAKTNTGQYDNVKQHISTKDGFDIDALMSRPFEEIEAGTSVDIPEGYLKITEISDTEQTTLCNDLPAACLAHSFPGIVSDALPQDDQFSEITKFSPNLATFYAEVWPDAVLAGKTADREAVNVGGLYGFNKGQNCIVLPQPKTYTASRFFDIPCSYKGLSEPLNPNDDPKETAYGWMIHKYCASKADNASFNVSMLVEGHTTGAQGQEFMDFLRNDMPAAKLTPTRAVPNGEKCWNCWRGPVEGRCYRDPQSGGIVFVPTGLDENTFDYNRSGYTELQQLQGWLQGNVSTQAGVATWTAHADPEVPGSGTEHTFDYTVIDVLPWSGGQPPNRCWDTFVRDVVSADGPLEVWCGYDVNGDPIAGNTYNNVSQLFDACVALNEVLDSSIAVQPGRQTGTNQMVMGPYRGEMKVRNYLTGATLTYAKAVQYLSNPYFSECETDIGEIIGDGF